MNPKSYQPPNDPLSTRVRCPVCHEVVYSRAGIHPQCAVRRADPPKPKAKPVGSPESVEELGVEVIPVGGSKVIPD